MPGKRKRQPSKAELHDSITKTIASAYGIGPVCLRLLSNRYVQPLLDASEKLSAPEKQPPQQPRTKDANTPDEEESEDNESDTEAPEAEASAPADSAAPPTPSTQTTPERDLLDSIASNNLGVSSDRGSHLASPAMKAVRDTAKRAGIQCPPKAEKHKRGKQLPSGYVIVTVNPAPHSELCLVGRTIQTPQSAPRVRHQRASEGAGRKSLRWSAR